MIGSDVSARALWPADLLVLAATLGTAAGDDVEVHAEAAAPVLVELLDVDVARRTRRSSVP